MSILDKYNNSLLEDEESDESSNYTTPAVLREDKEGLTIKKSFWISLLLHPSVVGAAWIITIILALLGFNMHLFDKPKPKMNDIEFVLVDKEDTPINKNTPYRSDRNSRAGGHHDPTRKVSMPATPSAPAAKSSAPAQASKPAAQPKAQPKAQPVQKPTPAKNVMQNLMPKPTPKAQQTPAPPAPKAAAPAKPNPPTARPSIKPPNTPKPVAKPSSAFQVPVPKGGTTGGHYATGPVSGSGKLANGGSSGGSGSSSAGRYTPAPVLAPTGGGSSSGSKLAKGGSGGGSGGYGNPGPGNPNGRPGIDAIREPDFGPYMRELQRRIKMNWNPPKGNESKRVVLLFKIAKDGRLLSCSVFKSSGLPSSDNAAINAVKLTAPFKPLPAEFKGQSIDIQFTFDYNVFGASGY